MGEFKEVAHDGSGLEGLGGCVNGLGPLGNLGDEPHGGRLIEERKGNLTLHRDLMVVVPHR